jgi:putative transposase
VRGSAATARTDRCTHGGVHSKRLRRLPCFDYIGPQRYSLTFCVFERRALFENRALVQVVLQHILQAARCCAFEVLAYCFMPDHVHLFVQANSEDACLTGFVKQAKQMSGYYGQRIARQRVWQPGYFERVLREKEETWQVIAYILDNPVRAGFVNNPGEFAFSGSGVCTLSELLEYVQFPSSRPT